MALLERLFGHTRGRGVVAGDNAFELEVDTLRHQTALEEIYGMRRRDGTHLYCAALLAAPSAGRHQRHAVVVMIYGIEVGLLDRDNAGDLLSALRKGRYTDAACEALIVCEWNRVGDERGNFGVRLNAKIPLNLYPAKEWRPRRNREVAL